MLNAADEVAVAAFLAGGLPFAGIADVIEGSLDALGGGPIGHFEELFEVDAEAREVAAEPGRGRGGARMSWLLAFAGFAFLIIAPRGRALRGREGGRDAGRALLPLLSRRSCGRCTRGETEYGIGAIPLGGFVKITGMNPDEELPPEVAPRGYYHQPVWKRIVVIGAGPAVNLVIAFVILFFLAFEVSEPTKVVDSVRPGSPAAAVLEPGDELIAVDGERGDLIALRDQISTHECAGEQRDGCRAETPAELVVLRDGREVEVSARPVYDAEAGRPLLGFAYGSRPLDPGVAGAAAWSADRMWEVTSQTVSIVGRIFDAEQREQISGVVGSYEVTRQSIEFDARQALFVIGLISLSLAVINLFPFLPLDGGHIFWSLVEKVRGRPVSFRVMERASRRRLRARADAVRDRAQQRHRTALGRGLRRSLIVRAVSRITQNR